MGFLTKIDLAIYDWLQSKVAGKPTGRHGRAAVKLASKPGRRRAYGLSTMQRMEIWQQAMRSVQAQMAGI